jgi:hypothetical protein
MSKPTFTEIKVSLVKSTPEGMEVHGYCKKGKIRYSFVCPDDALRTFQVRIYVPVSPTQRAYWRRDYGDTIKAQMRKDTLEAVVKALERHADGEVWPTWTSVMRSSAGGGGWAVRAHMSNGDTWEHERNTLTQSQAKSLAARVDHAGEVHFGHWRLVE